MLRLDLKIAKSEFHVQEEPLCDLTVTNAGSDRVSIAGTKLRLVDVRTGAESTRTRRGLERQLDRNKSFRTMFPLAGLSPGTFEVSAIAADAESAPVRVTVKPSTPANLALDTIQGSVCYGVWVDRLSEQVMRTRFDVLPGGGVRETVPIGPATLRSRPAISVPRNGGDRSAHWVAWDGKIVRVEADGTVSPPKEAPKEVVGPLFDGAAIPRPACDWAQNFHRSDGSRVTLHVRGAALFADAKLHEWDSFVAIGATLGLDDVVRGATLHRSDLDRWEFDRAGFRVLGRAPAEPVSEALVRVSGTGQAVVLVRRADEWLWNSRPVAKGPMPVEVAFLGSQPVLLGGVEGGGFRMTMLDGRPLPPKPF